MPGWRDWTADTGCLHRETVPSTCGPSAGGQDLFGLPLNPLALKPEWNICCPQSVVSTKGMETNGTKPQLFPQEKEMWKWSCLNQCIVMPAIPNEPHVVKNRRCCIRPCATDGTPQLLVGLWHSRGKMKHETYIYLYKQKNKSYCVSLQKEFPQHYAIHSWLQQSCANPLPLMAPGPIHPGLKVQDLV